MTPTLIIDNGPTRRHAPPRAAAHKPNVRPARLDPDRMVLLEHLAQTRRQWTIETATAAALVFMAGMTCGIAMMIK